MISIEWHISLCQSVCAFLFIPVTAFHKFMIRSVFFPIGRMPMGPIVISFGNLFSLCEYFFLRKLWIRTHHVIVLKYFIHHCDWLINDTKGMKNFFFRFTLVFYQLSDCIHSRCFLFVFNEPTFDRRMMIFDALMPRCYSIDVIHISLFIDCSSIIMGIFTI